MLPIDGVPTHEDLAAKMPPAERLATGPVVMVECFQPIPCDPCYHACPRQAFRPMADLNAVPEVDYSRCNGCAACVTRCPGLAIFVVDTSRPGEAFITLPYDFLPLPAPGEAVAGVDRFGRTVCTARVDRVTPGGARNKTALVRLAVPPEYAMAVRHFRSVNHG